VEKQREENRVAGPRNVQSQLDALRNQLDPHFLFNSLNTLASLIDFENDEAQQYLERLSDVYRYVLVSRDKNTVTLEEEIAFLDAYVYLNKVRFRENLQVVKDIWPGLTDSRWPR
jgi:LytS/YehU family sensor histidine kinase